MEPLTEEQIQFAKDCMIQWIMAAYKGGYFDTLEHLNGKEAMQVLYPNIYHSALLERLLEGNQMLAEPPPRAFSYPWYRLGENGTDTIIDIGFWTDGTIAINQGSYHVVEKINDDEYIVSYDPDQGKRERTFRLKKEGYTWRLSMNQ